MKKFSIKLTASILLWLLSWSGAAESLESSPWIGWRKGYDSYDRAGAFKEDNQFDRALEFYRRSRDYFAAIKKHFPQWNPAVVDGRIRLCEKEIAEMQKLTGARAGNTSRNSSGTDTPVGINNDARSGSGSRRNYRSDGMPPVHEVDSRNGRSSYSGSSYNNPVYTPSAVGGSSVGGNSGRLYIEMQSEIEQYRQRLRNALMEIDSLQIKLRQSEARSRDIDGVLRDYRLLQEKYSLLEIQYKNAMERSVGGDRERYENQIMNLKLANDEALKNNRKLLEESQLKDREYAVSRTEVLKLRDDLQKQARENRRLQRELELQRSRSAADNNQSDLAAKLKNMEQEMQRKDQRIDRLMRMLGDNAVAPEKNSAGDNAEIKRLKSELAALKKNALTEEELRRQISTLIASESDLKRQLADAGGLLQLRSKELQAMQKSDREQQMKLRNITAENQKNNLRISSLEKELQNSLDRYSALEKRHQARLKADSINHEKLINDRRSAEKALLESQKKVRMQDEDLGKLRLELNSAQALVKNSRAAVIDLTAKVHSGEVELRKMAALQKAYDELKERFDLFNRASNSDVLTALNRIPGLEESLKRYEKENTSLIAEINQLKQQRKNTGSKSAAQLADDNEKIETLLADARAAEIRGNWEIAIWGYRQVLARDRNNLPAAAALGKIYLKNGKYADAFALLTPVVKVRKTDAGLTEALARAAIGKRDYDTAIKILNAYKRNNKNRLDSALLLTEAVAWSRSGKTQDAEKAFRQVLKMDPGNAEAAYELALMFSGDEKRRKEAGEFYMLAKNNGIGVDSYLEELLRNFSNTDHVTRDFLLNNIADALAKNDLAGARWYATEAGKIFAQDKDVKFMQAAIMLADKQFAAAAEKLHNDQTPRGKFLYTAALIMADKLAEGEKTLKALPMIQKTLLPAITLNILQQESVACKGKKQQLINALLAKLK